MNYLPRLNARYWLAMLLCTTMGELIGNLLSRNFELGYTRGALIDILVFASTVGALMMLKLERDWSYWLLILMGNIGGTNLADWVTLEPLANDKKWGLLKPLQLGTEYGSLAVAGALLFVLIVRYYSTRNSNNENSRWSDSLYWAAILLSSTFGTTSGDLITNDTPLGAFGGSIALLLCIGVVYFFYKSARLSKVAAYWMVLVLMHPVGATIGNYISKPIGLNWGNVYTNLGLIVLFFVTHFSERRSLSAEGGGGPKFRRQDTEIMYQAAPISLNTAEP